jgi:alkylation response protein AidB-like acyl-CoA dehydrogenase
VHFGLTDEQKLLQETVRGFVAAECPPTRLRELFDAGSGHDPTLWKGLAEMGVTGLLVSERFGGAGLELLEAALVAEELGAGALPAGFFGHALACLSLVLAGSPAQQERHLPALASGATLGSVALAEAGDVWEPAGWSVSAQGGRLRGSKRHVPGGAVAELLVVGTSGGGLALVSRGAGVRVEPERALDRTRALATLHFEGAACEVLPGGAAQSARLFDAGLALCAADAFGAAWRLVRTTVEYAKSRQQFGQPIAQFQAVKHQLADMATALEPARGLFWYAAHAWDHLPAEASRAAAIAKHHLTSRAAEVARAAVELHGGLGFTWECDVQIWLKRILFDRAFLGAPERHRARCAELGGW